MGRRYHNQTKNRIPNDGLTKKHGFKRETIQNDGDAERSIGFTINETWGALKRCWAAYKAAAKDQQGRRDYDKAVFYARRIRKLQYELGITISEFQNLDLLGTEPEDVDLLCD